MMHLREIEEGILAVGRVDGPELESLRQRVYSGGKVGRQEADFLVELHRRVEHRSPAFERFYYQALKDHVLSNGGIDAEEADWLRRSLGFHGKLADEERKLLHELKGEARHVGRDFQVLFDACMKQPAEQRTCG